MKSIQDAGREILTNNPCKMYIFTGEEWGCVIDKFLPEKYKLVPIGTIVEPPHDFKHSTVCALRNAS